MRNPGDPLISARMQYLMHKCKTQGIKNGLMEVGVGHSSDEASNDR